jgi:UDP-glucose 4-epimerase
MQEKDFRYKICITGVTGFIGLNLVRRLLDDGRYDIIGIDNLSYSRREKIPEGITFCNIDIRDMNIFPLFEDIDYVFHLAGKNCLADCQDDPVDTADINVMGTVNVFEACRHAGVKKIIYAESSGLYEGISEVPTPETNVSPQSFYSVSKLAGRLFAEAYSRYYKMNFTALRYFNVYGAGQDYRRTFPPMFSAFIMNMIKGKVSTIWGDGEKRRDFIFVDDINDFHIQCIHDRRTDNETFNLGSGVNYSVKEIYAIISELMGYDLNPIYKKAMSWEAEVTLADISKAKALGWFPKTDIRDGLKASIEFLKNEMNNEKGISIREL